MVEEKYICRELIFLLIPDAGKDGGQKQKKASEDEMAGWHHRCNGHELGQTSGDGGDREAWHAAVHEVTESDMTG